MSYHPFVSDKNHDELTSHVDHQYAFESLIYKRLEEYSDYDESTNIIHWHKLSEKLADALQNGPKSINRLVEFWLHEVEGVEYNKLSESRGCTPPNIRHHNKQTKKLLKKYFKDKLGIEAKDIF